MHRAVRYGGFLGAVDMQSLQESEPPKAQTRSDHSVSSLWNRAGVSHFRSAFLAAAVLALATALFGQAAHGQQVTSIDREYTIKAAFLYHFLTYIDWPAGTFVEETQPFVIGVFETDPFGTVLDKIANTKNVGGRPIEILRMQETERLLECHIVFVPGSVAPEVQKHVLALLANSHVLVVGETEDFVEQGGAAQFFVEGNKVRFAFNTDAVERSNLKVSSKLLSLAKIITTR